MTGESGVVSRGAERSRTHQTGAGESVGAFPSPDGTSDVCVSTVVVGLGNEIACDDAVGVLAARRLRRLLAGRPNVDVVELPWAGLHLLDALRGYRRALLIDSLRGGRFPPGTVVRLAEHDFAGSVRLNSFHDMSYPTAMAFGRSLGWPLPSRVEIYAVEGQSLEEFGTRLTPVVRQGLDKVVELVAARLGAGAQPESPIGEEVADACSV